MDTDMEKENRKGKSNPISLSMVGKLLKVRLLRLGGGEQANGKDSEHMGVPWRGLILGKP